MHKMKSLLSKANEAQSKAISFGEGPMLVLAGPGSGKTFTITQRIQYLIEEHHVKPEHILVITFTKAAAKEMQVRFIKLLDGQILPVSFGTFHAIFFHILQHTYSFDARNIIKESEKKQFLKEILHTIPTELVQEDGEVLEHPEVLQRILEEISQIKNLGISYYEYQSNCCTKAQFQYIYEQYHQLMKQKSKLDFDDMVLLCYQLLKKRTDVLQLWQKKFQYILIDEFQDINPMQYEVVKLLALPQNNLFIVGDDDQSIYGFRGSRPEIMLHFQEDYPNVQRILLNQNYRSQAEIVEASLRLIKHNQKRFTKVLEAAFTQDEKRKNDCNYQEEDIAKNKTHQENNKAVSIYCFESKFQQAQNIVQLTKQYIEQKKGEYKDIAIIYRTNTLALLTAEKFAKEGTPFQLKEQMKNIYDTSVAKDIIAYIQYALYEKNVQDFFRIMNRPVRYITRESVPLQPFTKDQLMLNLQDKGYVIHNVITLYKQFEFIKKCTPYAAINYIRKGIGYDAYLKERSKVQGRKWEDEIKILDALQEHARAFDSLKEWLEIVTHMEDTIKQAQERNEENAVQLMTMHASKGLEFPVVIIPDLNEGVIPYKKAVTEEQLEEERRMLYVAMTRAKEKLFLFYVKENEPGMILPSRFLQEIECL